MKSFVAILALVAVAAADVSHVLGSEAGAQIEEQKVDVYPDQYNYIYKTSNGISAQESGALTNVGKENEAISVQGSNHYISPEGIPIDTTYVANENGYFPQGAHLPTPPAPQPIPEYILRAIKYIEDHPQKNEKVLIRQY